ncbi:MAG: alpha/beta hydrolase [Sulfurifustaceae bacterium]
MDVLLLIRRLLVIAALGASMAGCTGVFFQPYRTLVRTPDDIGLAYEDVRFKTADGVALHGWFLPANATACATVLFLHGNAENISTHIGSVYWMPRYGFNVFLPDYRGYGASSGTPSLPGVQADIDAAIKYVLGQSLGGASAVYYAAYGPERARIRALVVDSAFSSHRDIAREKLAGFWLTWPLQYPLAWTIDDDYSPLAAVPRVAPIPLLLIHGEADSIVPVHHSERLYAAAREPKEFWKIEGAGHIETLHSTTVRARLVSYLYSHACPTRPVPAVK